MDTIRNVTQLFIGKDPTRGAAVDELINSYTQLADGEVVLTTPGNVVLNNATTAAEAEQGFKIIQRSGTTLIHSDIILPKKVLNYNLTPTAKESQQLDYVGLDPSAGVNAGDFVGVANNIYTIRLNILDKTTAGFMQQKIKEGFYKSNTQAASYTPQAIAFGLVTSLRANYSRETEQDLKFDVVTNSATKTASLGTTDVVSGSKFITLSADAPTIGTAIRFQEGVAIENTDHVYIVVGSPSAGVYELNIAYNGTTQQLPIGDMEFDIALDGDFGVRIWGVDREFKAGYFWSNVIFWETQVDFDTDVPPPVNTYAAYPGVGTGQYIANLEGELQADEFIYRGFPEAGVVNRTDGIGTTWYDVCVIEYEDTLEAAQGTPTKSPKTIMIAWDVDVNGDGTLVSNAQEADALGLLALDQIIVTLWGIGSAQVGNVT